ncbi:hypothetical protein F3087_34025 [Nocardia colli]|uniref:Competence protein CoiA-like family protein n=1 Tax=Nocardia colli TaxID=2545717 RepID=A0A5N0E7V1_9NOCA|nr:hypothetical protein [Nocardia colli]KAA8884244.1 hypothetical protein F3087_34025 [Nocardia colli]
MDAALGRYDEYIDIRDPGVFATWQKTSGLRCLVCQHPVTVYHSSAKNPFVRHGKGFGVTGDRALRTSARETFLHFRLKHWVCAELRVLGSEDARVETHLEARTPDVFGHLHGRGFAVEVQWSRLDHSDAQARTRDLLAEGADEVLWLTRPCSWAEKLPVLGITSFNPAGDDYEAHTGFLTYRPRAGLRPAHISVRAFLRDWIAGDRLAWAHPDHKKGGWATVTDWQQHTKAQAEEIAAKKRQLAAALTERDDLRAKFETACNSLRTTADKLTRQTTAAEQALTYRKQLEAKITSQNAELHRADQSIKTAERERSAAQQKMTDLTDRLAEQATQLNLRAAAIFALIGLCLALVFVVLLT